MLMDVRVTYDFQTFIEQSYGGISRYIYEIATRINTEDGFTSRILAPFYKNNYLSSSDSIVAGMRLPWDPVTRQIYRKINWIASPFVAKFTGTDILHETYYQHRPIPIKHKAVVLTIYDMIHERFKHLFPISDATMFLKKDAILRADYIICISESTRRDLLEYFNLPESKITVIHLGFNETIDTQSEFPPFLLKKPYLLYVGSRIGYKNFDRLLRAYSSSPILLQTFSLVCFGGGGFDRSELKLFAELGLNNNHVMQLGGNDALLQTLYKQATLFVCPSLYEGFGITLLEAMNAGCPIACSTTSSLPEVAGDAAQYFDPYDVESIKYALEILAESDSIRADLIERGLRRVSFFSWSKCAQETLASYKHVLGLHG